MANLPLIACHERELLQRETQIRRGMAACCSRCGAVLYRSKKDSSRCGKECCEHYNRVAPQIGGGNPTLTIFALAQP